MSWEFVKIYRSILDSSIANDVIVRHIFIDILLLADKDGRVDIAPTAIARRTGWSVEQVHTAIADLCSPDPESRTPGHNGARLIPIPGQGFGWTIPNFRTYAERGTSSERMRNLRSRRAEEPTSEEPPASDTPARGAEPTPKRPAFIPPTVEEVAAEIARKGGPYLSISPVKFVAHYETNGWVQGRNKPVKNWKACLTTWLPDDSKPTAKPRTLAEMVRSKP